MSKELAKTYDPKAIEEKLYEKWCENKYFHAEVDRSRKPFTTVMPPPNITGKLHMGHALDNTLQDILIRKNLDGKDSLSVHGSGKKSMPEQSRISLRSSVFPATGTESVLRWMRDARKRLKKYLSNYMKKDIFTKDQGSSTGVRNVRHLFQMQR